MSKTMRSRGAGAMSVILTVYEERLQRDLFHHNVTH